MLLLDFGIERGGNCLFITDWETDSCGAESEIGSLPFFLVFGAFWIPTHAQ